MRTQYEADQMIADGLLCTGASVVLPCDLIVGDTGERSMLDVLNDIAYDVTYSARQKDLDRIAGPIESQENNNATTNAE